MASLAEIFMICTCEKVIQFESTPEKGRSLRRLELFSKSYIKYKDLCVAPLVAQSSLSLSSTILARRLWLATRCVGVELSALAVFADAKLLPVTSEASSGRS